MCVYMCVRCDSRPDQTADYRFWRLKELRYRISMMCLKLLNVRRWHGNQCTGKSMEMFKFSTLERRLIYYLNVGIVGREIK